MPKQLSYKTILAILLLFVHANKLAAQHEYVATIDPVNGTIKRLDSVPGVMYINPHAVLDENNMRFLFIGLSADQLNRSLYSIDMVTGKMVSKAVLPKSPSLITMRYDGPLDRLYGITVLSGVYSLVSIDTKTGVYTTINTIKSMRSLAEEMVIDNHHRIFLNCLDTTGRFALISLDVNGNLLSKNTLPNITGLQYDNTVDKLYGITYNGTQNQLAQVDPLTASVTNVSNLPTDLMGVLQYSTTFDEHNRRYIYGSGTNLISIDVKTGSVLYKTPAPASSNAVDKDNVIQFRYSYTLRELYTLHWKAKEEIISPCALSADFKTHYNLLTRSLIINKTPTTCITKMTLYTGEGQVVIENKLISNGYNAIRLPALTPGLYIAKMFSGNHLLRSDKVLIYR
ncbi:MAG: hypothetical protein ABI581_13035 [Sediminibacterium sp.]